MEIILYEEGTGDELDTGEIARYLARKMGTDKVELRGNPFALDISDERLADYAGRIAGTKIRRVTQEVSSDQNPLPAEIDYEKRRILGRTSAFGIIYDGFQLHRIFREVVPRSRSDTTTVIVTNRLFGTWDYGDRRYHLRTSIYGRPSLISTTGLIEAPARPREYYLLKQGHERMGRDLTELKDRLNCDFMDYKDKRLTEVAKGYVMQAVFYSITGDPFCEDKGCRLYNAHRQEELIFAQLTPKYELCERHENILDDLRRGRRCV
jgi:hypothetical protein